MRTRRLKLMTYNIHSGIGVDGRYELSRIERVIEEEKPDIVALQELDCRMWRTSYDDQADRLASALSLNAAFCATRPIEQGAFGMAVLSRFAIAGRRLYDLSYRPHREPRYCLRIDFEVEPGMVLHVFNCHLGLAIRERTFQRNKLLNDSILLGEDLHQPVVVMGDFNDRPLSVVHRSLRRHFSDAYDAAGKWWGPTFKAGPLPLRLDHIYAGSGIRVVDCRVRVDELTRVASDHRPLIATVDIEWPSTGRTPAAQASAPAIGNRR